jgi:penicillin amidase
LQSAVTVIRDKWGVPHIYADNPHDLFFAEGYVHAQDRLWQMEFWRRIGAGRLSEVLGKSTLSNDLFIRTIGWRRASEADYQLLGPSERDVLQSFADGVNAFINTLRDNLPIEFTILGLTGA